MASYPTEYTLTSQHESNSPTSSGSDSLFTPSAPPTLAQPPQPKPRPSKKKGPGHISRPPNAFLLFRSDFWAHEKQKPEPVERDHRDISRIAAHCWRSLDPVTKQGYHNRAQGLRELHRLKYPEYRLKPAARRPRIPKRKTGPMVVAEERCRRLASSIIGSVVSSQQISGLRTPDLAAPRPIHPTGYTPYFCPSQLDLNGSPQPLFSSEPCTITSLLDDLNSLPPLPTLPLGPPESEPWPTYAFEQVETQAADYYGLPYQQVQYSPLPLPDFQYLQDSPLFSNSSVVYHN